MPDENTAGYQEVQMYNPKLRVKFLRSKNVLGEEAGAVDRTFDPNNLSGKGAIDVGNLFVTIDEGEAYIDIPDESATADVMNSTKSGKRLTVGGIHFVDTDAQKDAMITEIGTQVVLGKRPLRKIIFSLESMCGYMVIPDATAQSGFRVRNVIQNNSMWNEFVD